MVIKRRTVKACGTPLPVPVPVCCCDLPWVDAGCKVHGVRSTYGDSDANYSEKTELRNMSKINGGARKARS